MVYFLGLKIGRSWFYFAAGIALLLCQSCTGCIQLELELELELKLEPN